MTRGPAVAVAVAVAVAIALGATRGDAPDPEVAGQVPDAETTEEGDAPPVRSAPEDASPVELTVSLEGDGDHASIGAALAEATALNAEGRAVTVTIGPGTYREGPLVIEAVEGATDAPLTLAGRGEVVISGSERYTDWDGDGPVVTHPWTHDWGISEVSDAWYQGYGGDHLRDNPVILRREMVFVDGRLMTPRTTRAETESEPGSFYVDEDGDRLHLHLPQGADADTATIEVAERDSLLVVNGRRNVDVSGLTLVHAASPAQGRALAVRHARDVTLSDLRIQWNSWGGLGVSSSRDVTVLRVAADHNGVAGMNGYRLDDLLVEESSTSFNGWRGARGLGSIETDRHVDRTFVDFAGGQKFLSLRRARFLGHTAVGNLASGLWFDSDNVEVVVEDGTFNDNLTWGVFVEASHGPVELRSSRMCGNETGLLLSNSAGGRVTGNLVSDNRLTQLFLAGSETRTVTDRDTGQAVQVRSEDWEITGNTIVSGPDQLAFGTRLDAGPWAHFVATSTFGENRWMAPRGAGPVFRLPGAAETGFEGWERSVGRSTGTVGTAATGDVDCGERS